MKNTAGAPSRGHPVAWMIWGTCAAGAALLFRHPVYLALIGLAGAVAGMRLGSLRISARTIRWTAGLILFPGVLNGLLSRSGSTILLKLPWGWLGGPYTLEAFLFGITAGVQLAALLAVMVALQKGVEPTDVLRRMPAALYPLGVSAAIGLSFTSRARRALAAVREAQLVRGHRPRGGRDFPGWAAPLLVLSLENAQEVAEALVVRGWPEATSPNRARGWAAAGWLAWAAALLLIAFDASTWWLAVALGLLAAAAFVAAWRGTYAGPRYRPEIWTRADSLMVGLSLGSAAVVALLASTAPGWLSYSPYPTAAWPEVRGALILVGALFAIPAWGLSRD
ncbi:MAG: energy-coupling factor transporter transmembrane component T [Anaerolineales bacterium]